MRYALFVKRLHVLFFGASKPCPLNRYVVEGATHALLEVIKRRAQAGQSTYWQHVGVFSVVEHKARRRKIWTMKNGVFWSGHVISPAAKKIAFRPSAAMVRRAG